MIYLVLALTNTAVQMSSEVGEAPRPAQVLAHQALYDFRYAASGPTGYKKDKKRKYEEIEAQVHFDVCILLCTLLVEFLGRELTSPNTLSAICHWINPLCTCHYI